MNKIQTKKIIFKLAKEWRLKKVRPFLAMVDFLDKGTNKKLSFSNEFEFSVVEAERNIRSLHLNFWQSNLSVKKVQEIIVKREGAIISILKLLNRQLRCEFSLPLAKKIFRFNRQSGCWPIQFGLEYSGKSKPKIKIYLSINGDYFHLKKFCDKFELNYEILNKKFKNKKFDTIAIDFSPDNDYCFKFYPLVAINKGLLCRVDKESRVTSVKIWLRFPIGLFIDDERINKFIRLPAPIHKIIKDNNFKIHYLCEENGKKSVYFR